MNSSREVYEKFQTRGGVADLSDRVKLRLTGTDRVRYLNGQVTSNVTKLTTGHTQPACITTAKGKLCAEILITSQADALLIDADATLRETLPARLERYIISDDAALEDVSDELRLLHFLPPVSADRALPAALSSLPSHPAHRFGREGADFFLTPDEATRLFSALAADFPPLPPEALESLRIEAGIPRWGRELDENTLPPEAGLDRTHIDYHKGCYIGQEVISRLKSVGHVNRQLTGFLVEGDALPPLGAAIIEEDTGRTLGVVTSAVFSFALERPIALGYLKRGSPDRGRAARLSDASGPAIRLTAAPLPFVVP